MNIDWGMVGAVATIIGAIVTAVGVIVAIIGIIKGNGNVQNIKKINKQSVSGFSISNNEIKQENNK